MIVDSMIVRHLKMGLILYGEKNGPMITLITNFYFVEEVFGICI